MGGDIKGGGLSYFESNTHQNPNLVFTEGLRSPRTRMNLELDGLATSTVYGKKKGYDRVSFSYIINYFIYLYC